MNPVPVRHQRGTTGGVRRHRHLDPARRRRRPADVLRVVRLAAPRAGGRRHRRQRRPAGPGAQGRRASCHTCSPTTPSRRSPATTPSATPATAPPGRQTSATSNRSSSRRCTARWPLAHNGNLVNAPALRDELLDQGLRADRHERHRGDDADAGRGRRQDVGGAHRAHAAGVEGRLLAGHAGRRSRARRARPVGLPAAVASAASPTAATPSPRRRAR